LAERHYHSICEWLDQPESELHAFSPDLYPQGSVALGTTVKPQFREEYDVDLVCELQVDHRSVPRPVLLLDLLERRMRQNEIYRPKLERKNRCLRVNYEHDFHLDILPACPDPESGSTTLVVPDRADEAWRASNPKGFKKWFQQQGALKPAVSFSQKAMDSAAPLPQPQTVEQKNTFQLSVQLIKRWRDLHFAEVELAPVSIVLTTLLGLHYSGEQSIFANLAMSTESILDSLPTSGRLIVLNPSHPQEELGERWKDNAKYTAFVNGIRNFKKRLIEISDAEDMGRQSEMLQAIFGEKITKRAFEEQGRSIEEVRNSRKLGIARSAGIVSLTANAAAPIRKNTFYGDI
jgi:hypothetical protein